MMQAPLSYIRQQGVSDILGGEVRVLTDSSALFHVLAEQFVGLANDAIARRERFAVALSGGSTPRPLYERLASREFVTRMDWKQTDVFFSDERCVPPDDERSNYRLAADTLLRHVGLPPVRLHRMRGENNPAVEASRYENEVRITLDSALPRFDLILLGLGENGHTASLFPGTAALEETTHIVASQYIKSEREWRLTFTRPILNAAAHVWVMVSGRAKASVIQRVLQGPVNPVQLPAQYLPSGSSQLTWWLDADAASLLRFRTD